MDGIDKEELNDEVKISKAIADSTRLMIIKLSMERVLYICDIMIALKKTQSSISHNLSTLEDAGLINEEKRKVVSLQAL